MHFPGRVPPLFHERHLIVGKNAIHQIGQLNANPQDIVPETVPPVLGATSGGHHPSSTPQENVKEAFELGKNVISQICKSCLPLCTQMPSIVPGTAPPIVNHS